MYNHPRGPTSPTRPSIDSSNAIATTAFVAGMISDFASRDAAIAANIPPNRTYLRTAGYTTAGDGGAALYRRVGSAPTHPGKFQSADGAWWEIAERTLTPYMFGAVSNSTGTGIGTDALAAFNALRDTAMALETDAFILGSFRLSGTWLFDYSGQTGENDYRVPLRGAGERSTYLYFDDGLFNGIKIIGGVTNATNISLYSISGFYLCKNDRQGQGVWLEGHFHATMKDVHIIGFERGIYGQDIHEFGGDNVVLRFNNYGMLVQKGTFTQPNIITLVNCTVGNNANSGIDLVNPATFQMLGGSIESNGIGGADATKFGIRAIYNVAAVEGSVGLNMLGVYLEANTASADILIVDNDSAPMVHNIIGCSFQRSTAASFATNCIAISWTGTTFTHYLNLIGNGFRSFNDYVPTGARPYINVFSASSPNNIEINEIGNFYEDAVETVQLAASRYGLLKDLEITARGEVTAAGALSIGRNITSVTKTTTGTYAIVFTKPMATANYHVTTMNIAGTFSVPCVTAIATTGFTFEMRNPASNALQDTRFSFTVAGAAL